ncbi:peroxisome biogenesis factor 1 like protein [Danaus plexippus plexippus]|uniref:Peroxisomal ATPase PEX1 n=1 Tax=Danaus plexippus plexippus TaxID=278856 RepID=A0A212EMK0_DANPL|nr:peroxisome biogenesis factor 1 like protein [Danaus plexippus plexippus]
MLGGNKLKVSFTHERSCFGYISTKHSTNNEQSQCVQVLYREKQIFLWAVFNSNIPEGNIACNPVFSKVVGLDEGVEVFVAPYGDVKVLDQLYIDTDSPDDQEILEHNVEVLQLRILDQLRLVAADQKAVVWISTSMPIVFTPKTTGLLVNHSRIIVKIDAFNSLGSDFSNQGAATKGSHQKYNNIGIINDGLLSPYLNPQNRLILRALPIEGDGKKNLIHPYTVFIHEDLIDESYKDLMVILATMNHIPSVLQEDEVESHKIDGICVEIVTIDNTVFRSLCREVYNENIPTVLIPKSLNVIINVEMGVKLIFNIIGDKVELPDHVDIITYSEKTQTEIDVIEKFKKCVVENTHSGKMFLINDGMVKQNTHISHGFLRFKLQPERLKYTMLNSESFRNCSVAAKCLTDADFDCPKKVTHQLEYDFKNYCRSIKSSQELVDDILSHIHFEIQREASFKGVSEIKSNVLITGSSGAGKSAICHIVQKELTLWSHILHCRALKGRKDVTEVIGKAILMCQEHSPSVLICDDLDALIPPNTEGASPQDIAYYQRLASCIKQMLQSCSSVCVLMTSLSLRSLHPVLRQFSGRPLFTAHFDIPQMNQDDRIEVFKHLLNDKIRESVLVEEQDVATLATDTAGCNVREILEYFNKRIFKAVKNKSKPSDRPRLIADISKELEKANTFDIWGSVGGMHDVKRQITEAIFWPIMYPSLFPSSSCGILLYGPPGSGKSLIGSCLSSLTNMRVLTVKGPELLSKYIGQSEKAVRDIFDKADMQRPCILFFDEFDSLAPKRGHDSTGVTDRVVNQLLSRLDGAEGGARGPVLAATSRPDLVDPALLRPGRLMLHLYCGLPDQADRVEVLRCLSRSVCLSREVDLSWLSCRTEGYSAADLKSLLVTAQLTRLEKQLAASDDKTLESVVVLKEDVEDALRETSPSLSPEQRLFYDTIYRRFRGEPLSPQQTRLQHRLDRQRVTLA